MGLLGLLVIMFIVGIATLIRAMFSKAGTESKRRLVIIGCVLVAVSLAFVVYLSLILIPSM